MNSNSFDPLVSEKSKVLILGTMPGVVSLQNQQYYANERNVFWPVIFKIFKKEFTNNYQIRKDLILENQLALWDTLKFCYREGSLDSNIKNAIPNEISDLINGHKNIKHIVFNGKSAQKFYNKFHPKIEGITYHCLPSTSPANARMKIEHKLNEWEIIKQLLKY